jgi:hypothetical protein
LQQGTSILAAVLTLSTCARRGDFTPVKDDYSPIVTPSSLPNTLLTPTIFLLCLLSIKTPSFLLFILTIKLMNQTKVLVWSIVTLLLLAVTGLVGCPTYRVYQQQMRGKAAFAEAEQNRRIKVEEARANLEAEKLNALAEIERAKGAAEAIKIENGALTPTYIQYLWVRQQSDLNDKTVIYIPTNGTIPVLEAGRGVLQGLEKAEKPAKEE